MNIARTSLELKRKLIQRLIDNGLFPYTKRYLGTLRNHFSTIGVNGINEMILNFTDGKHDITDEWGRAFAEKFLDYIRARLVKIQEETGHMYNLEATPAESATYRFAREDKSALSASFRRVQARTPIIPTLRSCRSALPTIRSRRWSCRPICSRNIPAARCCTSIWGSVCLRPRFAATLSNAC